MASTEAILDALSRSPDLTIRGIKGVIAEASFAADVVPNLSGWRSVPVHGQAYDFLLEDDVGRVSVQVKMQRRKAGEPLRANAIARKLGWPESYFIVETQKTRSGQDSEGGSTRPYRFGQFDVLAVSMGPSTGHWSHFQYTVGSWLVPDPADPRLIHKYQPVAPKSTSRWTDKFVEVVEWHRRSTPACLTDPPFP